MIAPWMEIIAPPAVVIYGSISIDVDRIVSVVITSGRAIDTDVKGWPNHGCRTSEDLAFGGVVYASRNGK